MGTWGSGLWGIGTPGSTAGSAISTLLDPALRIAGITKRPGIGPSTDQYDELIPVLNRMIGSYNLDGHRIYTTSIDEYALVDGQKIYTIGPGADFDNPRPIFITGANTIFPTDPQVRQPVKIMSQAQWRALTVQDISGAPAYGLYYDNSMDDSGFGRVYLYPQAPTGYLLELYTWVALADSFTAPTDGVVLPPGYAAMLTWNLGIEAAIMYPLESHLHPLAPEKAAQALGAVITSNSKAPEMAIEQGADGRSGGRVGYGWWLTGSGL